MLPGAPREVRTGYLSNTKLDALQVCLMPYNCSLVTVFSQYSSINIIFYCKAYGMKGERDKLAVIILVRSLTMCNMLLPLQ